MKEKAFKIGKVCLLGQGKKPCQFCCLCFLTVLVHIVSHQHPFYVILLTVAAVNHLKTHQHTSFHLQSSAVA